jgi:hypothetical protein
MEADKMFGRSVGAWIAAAGVPALLFVVGVPAGDAAPPGRRLADMPADKAQSNVDVELVLAVDVSYSMDPEEQVLQRDGYREALVSPDFLNALRQGMHGRVAITYVEWAGASDQRVIVPWRLVDGAASAQAAADEIGRQFLRRAARTSVSGALLYSAGLFDRSGFRGIRRVIDVSGDGTNNQGQLVDVARDEVVAKGITINGLPIMLKRPSLNSVDIDDLDVYYEDCVIGGPGAFVVPIREREKFKEAIRTKLVLEIAGRTPEARVVPASGREPRISCTIGERMWQQRWGGRGYDDFN